MYNYAQIFYISSSAVTNAEEVMLSSVKLHFFSKPKITGNKSGIYAPGVEVFIAPTTKDALPDIQTPIHPNSISAISSRLGYNEIETSLNGTSPSVFHFLTPVILTTDVEYALIVKFDGNEDFELWKNKIGELIVNTREISADLKKKGIGPLYIYTKPEDISSVSSLDNWKSISDAQLTFGIDVARYAHNGVRVSSNTSIINDPTVNSNISDTLITLSNGAIRMSAPSFPVEFVTFDRKYSKYDTLQYGDYVYQPQPFYPGDKAIPVTVEVTSGNNIISGNTSYLLSNGNNFSFLTTYSGVIGEYIVVTSLNHYGANNHAVNVRQVKVANGAGSIKVDEPFTFTNSAAYFFKAPVGRVYTKTKIYGGSTINDVILLAESNANSSVRFVNNSINSISISSGGTSFSNDDIVTISGYGDVANKLIGGYPAKATLATNSTGGIVNVYLSNTGCGFTNTANITYSFSNSTSGISAGSNATLNCDVFTVLKTEFGGGNIYFGNCEIINLEAMQITPDTLVHNPMGTEYTCKLKTMYYSNQDNSVSSGRIWNISSDDGFIIDVKNRRTQNFNINSSPVFPSRSNMFTIPYANGSLPDMNVIGNYYSNAAVFLFDVVSNNDFTSVSLHPEKLNSYYARYSINNDYTGEETNYGNAVAKHISSKVNLENDQFAEDLLVYLTAYRPAGTDIQIYARIHNSHDLEVFDDKQWTRLECVDGNKLYSSGSDPTDMIELTYNFQASPNTDVIVSNSVTSTLNSSIITGSNTTFSNSFIENDMIKLYQPLFPNNYIVGIIDTVSNNTQIVLKSPIANNGVVGSGLVLERLEYPLQAFNNITNDNVVRYYNSSRVEFDTFNTFQIKVVLLSNDDHIIPKIDDVKSVAVSS